MCTACKKPLSGQRFTSRDEFAYCLSCFCDLYAKKCAGCTNPISGECPEGPPEHSMATPRLDEVQDLSPWNCFCAETLGLTKVPNRAGVSASVLPALVTQGTCQQVTLPL